MFQFMINIKPDGDYMHHSQQKKKELSLIKDIHKGHNNNCPSILVLADI